jgi:hypothetical protein
MRVLLVGLRAGADERQGALAWHGADHFPAQHRRGHPVHDTGQPEGRLLQAKVPRCAGRCAPPWCLPGIWVWLLLLACESARCYWRDPCTQGESLTCCPFDTSTRVMVA